MMIIEINPFNYSKIIMFEEKILDEGLKEFLIPIKTNYSASKRAQLCIDNVAVVEFVKLCHAQNKILNLLKDEMGENFKLHGNQLIDVVQEFNNTLSIIDIKEDVIEEAYKIINTPKKISKIIPKKINNDNDNIITNNSNNKFKIDQNYLAKFYDFIQTDVKKYTKYYNQNTLWTEKQLVNLASYILKYQNIEITVEKGKYSSIFIDEIQEIFEITDEEVDSTIMDNEEKKCCWTKTTLGDKEIKVQALSKIIAKKFINGIIKNKK
jgi:hypothetical protein